MARPSTRARCSSALNRVMGIHKAKPRTRGSLHARGRRGSKGCHTQNETLLALGVHPIVSPWLPLRSVCGRTIPCAIRTCPTKIHRVGSRHTPLAKRASPSGGEPAPAAPEFSAQPLLPLRSVFGRTGPCASRTCPTMSCRVGSGPPARVKRVARGSEG